MIKIDAGAEPRVAIVPLAWDSEFFGFSVVRLTSGGTLTLYRAVERMRRNQPVLAYLELDPRDGVGAQAATAVGARLVDRRVELAVSHIGEQSADVEELKPIVSLRDRQALIALALISGEKSRFRRDPSVTAGRFEALYTTWMDNCIARQSADAVLVLRDHSDIVGMITVEAKSDIASIGLFAVDPHARGRGIGRRLLEGALLWARAAHCTSVRVATQGDNTVALAAYRALGFKVERTTDTYHLWINP